MKHETSRDDAKYKINILNKNTKTTKKYSR